MENKNKTQDDIRAERIARQSQMERAMEYYQMMGITPTVEDLVLTSHVLSNYIMDGWNSEYKNLVQRLDEHISKNYRG